MYAIMHVTMTMILTTCILGFSDALIMGWIQENSKIAPNNYNSKEKFLNQIQIPVAIMKLELPVLRWHNKFTFRISKGLSYALA